MPSWIKLHVTPIYVHVRPNDKALQTVTDLRHCAERKWK